MVITDTFQLTSEYIELIKLLKAVGFCATGGEAKQVVSDGMVKVDGKVETRKKCKIKIGQIVSYQGESIRIV